MITDNNFGKRDKRGNWKPNDKIFPMPKYIIPFKPLKLLKWIFGWNGYIFPMQFIWASIALVVWFFLTPSLSEFREIKLYTFSYILIRNSLIVFIYAGFFHLHFYIQKKQKNNFKYNANFLEKNSKFFFKDQTKDNLIWVFFSAVPIWSIYEYFTFWSFANNFVPFITWDEYPIYLIVLFFFVPVIRDIHFYLTHRLLHTKLFYKLAHKIHHHNVNPGPWSGLAMHPVEHIIYFSGILIHLILPSHPLIALWHIFHAGISPHAGHSGFDKIVFKNGIHLHTGTYFHYLHHKYFECNYSGDTSNYLDKWFGTMHDGSDESHQQMLNRLKLN